MQFTETLDCKFWLFSAKSIYKNTIFFNFKSLGYKIMLKLHSTISSILLTRPGVEESDRNPKPMALQRTKTRPNSAPPPPTHHTITHKTVTHTRQRESYRWDWFAVSQYQTWCFIWFARPNLITYIQILWLALRKLDCFAVTGLFDSRHPKSLWKRVLGLVWT